MGNFLSKVTTGRDTSHGVILGGHGEAGAGKTTLLLGIPGILLVDAERSSAHYEARRFSPDRWEDVLGITHEFWADQSAGQAIGFDSLDAIQTLVFDSVARSAGVDQVGQIPYGRGFDLAVAEFRKLWGFFDGITAQGRIVAWVCHSATTKVETPSGETYDRTGLKLNAKVAALAIERSDLVAHIGIRTLVSKNKTGDKGRATVLTDSDGNPERFFRCVPTGGVLAKTRFSHPAGEITPLTWTRIREFCK
jgi:hypothetical protein